jgi:nucleoside-diphosphate-sugar epimerase
LRRVLEWEPQISLESGLKTTYEWISAQLGKQRNEGIDRINKI